MYDDSIYTTRRAIHMMNDVSAMKAKVTSNGQVSLPAAMRRRWGTGSVLVIDQGRYAIVRPVPDDPIAALRGAYADHGADSEDLRAAERAAEQERESARGHSA
jgi:bifunctional DNA-binding transcriptional regulator/antitoxin component of YhaV-PrlF toxin-antitoxin module